MLQKLDGLRSRRREGADLIVLGNAIDLDCEDTRDGIIQNKTRRTYLTEYGVGLNRSPATSTAKFDWTYSDFEKDGEKAPAHSQANLRPHQSASVPTTIAARLCATA